MRTIKEFKNLLYDEEKKKNTLIGMQLNELFGHGSTEGEGDATSIQKFEEKVELIVWMHKRGKDPFTEDIRLGHFVWAFHAWMAERENHFKFGSENNNEGAGLFWMGAAMGALNRGPHATKMYLAFAERRFPFSMQETKDWLSYVRCGNYDPDYLRQMLEDAGRDINVGTLLTEEERNWLNG